MSFSIALKVTKKSSPSAHKPGQRTMMVGTVFKALG